MTPKFQLGNIVATPGAIVALREAQDSVWLYLNRHASGDWGDICKQDAKENEISLLSGFRIFSTYQIKDGNRIWIITEADRSSTCVLLPEEY